MLGFLSKLFGGNKSERDIKSISPVVQQINEEYEKLQSLPIDELRRKTQDFRARIAAHLATIDKEIAEKQTTADAEEDVTAKDTI